MYYATRFLLLLGLLLPLTVACQSLEDEPDGPVRVEIREEGAGFQLFRAGKPYYIKGAGGRLETMEALAEHGGNSVRTWGTGNAQEVLDKAQELGLTVTLGLNVTGERHGFNYGDAEAVAAQRERIRRDVMRFKDHPALIIWAIGNELNLNANNPLVWDAVNEISEMIHEIDPNHLTTTTLAGVNPTLIAQLNARAPDLDLLAIQLYAGIAGLPDHVRNIPIERPYIVTEWGATGHWEVAETSWGAPVENTSSVKADAYLERYQKYIASDTQRCLGYYVFLWGQKQERTPTWYGMFLEDRSKTEAVDVVHYIWKGEWPENRSPRIRAMRLDARTAYDNITVPPGATYRADVRAFDPDGDALKYYWEVMRESRATQTGGDREEVPEIMQGLVRSFRDGEAAVIAPSEPGAYRLFVYVFDGNGNAGHANIPFRVERIT